MPDSKLVINQNPEVLKKFKAYPPDIGKKFQGLRQLILETAEETEGITAIEETLKWGEPSYLVKKGSTVRIDWKEKSPEQYAIYFKCTSKLVLSFREVFGDKFNFEKNRAIVFGLNERIPKKALKKCIAAALRYHHLKDQKLLGLQSV